MAGYQMIAMDMDGTLLTSEKRILPETAAALWQAEAAGKTTAFCTGRGLAELSLVRRQLPFVRYAVTQSGACLFHFPDAHVPGPDDFEDSFDWKGKGIREAELKRGAAGEQAETLSGGELLEGSFIAPDVAEEVLCLQRAYDVMVHLLTVRESLAQADQMSRMADYNMGVYQDAFHYYARPVADMAQTIREELPAGIPKINLYFRAAADRKRCRERLRRSGVPVTMKNSEISSLELSPPGVNKGEGLKKLSAYLDIPLSKIIFCGDADNDADAILAAGLGIAMGNAAPEIKALADWTAPDCDHDGVGETIRRWLL